MKNGNCSLCGEIQIVGNNCPNCGTRIIEDDDNIIKEVKVPHVPTWLPDSWSNNHPG